MNQPLKIRTFIALLGVSIIVAIALGSAVASFHAQRNEALVLQKLQESRSVLSNLIVIINRNGTDATLQNIYHDCTERKAYESLLIKLSSLEKRDLISMQNLFESCGRNDAIRKALMVSRFEDQLAHFVTLTLFLSKDSENYHVAEEVAQWESLLSLEKKKSDLLTEQTDIQSEIISLLISGKSSKSSEVVTRVEDANQISELLTVYDHEADTLREKLVDKNAS